MHLCDTFISELVVAPRHRRRRAPQPTRTANACMKSRYRILETRCDDTAAIIIERTALVVSVWVPM